MKRPTRALHALEAVLNNGTHDRPAPAPVVVPQSAELVVTPLASKRVKPVRYLVPGRIPMGKLILFAGRGGSGKSTVLRSLSASLSTGRCALGLKYDSPAHAKVLIVAAEDGAEDTILPGLLAEGADVSQIAIVECVRRGTVRSDFTLAPEHVALVREHLRATPEIRLVMIDPIASFVGRAKVDDHKATELRLVLDPLSELAESTGVTIAMVAHLNKGGPGGVAVDRISGSAAYRDAVRAAYLVTEDPDDEARRLLMPIKENLSGFNRTSIPFGLVSLPDVEADTVLKREQFRHLGGEDLAAVRAQLRRVQFYSAVNVDPDEAMKAKKADGTKVAKCKEWLRTFLVRFAYPSNEILAAAKRAGYTFDNVKEGKSELKREGVINHSNSFRTGDWWSGTGDSSTWVARPDSPLPTLPTPHTPLSPLSPQKETEEITREPGSSGERSGVGSGSPLPKHGSEDVV